MRTRSAVLALSCLAAFSTLLACSGSDGSCDPETTDCTPAGELSTVIVAGQGTGSGRVLSNLLPFPPPTGTDDDFLIQCSVPQDPSHPTNLAKCEDKFLPGESAPGAGGYVELEALADAGSVFAGWFSGCSQIVNIGLGIGNGCIIDYSGLAGPITYTVTARFNLVAPAACNNPLTIQDQFASDAGWTATATTSNGTPTQSVSFQAAGGNSGGYRQMQHVFPAAGAISVYHYYGTTTYTPSTQGAIDHINYFEDQIELNPPFAGAAVGTGFSMTQGGARYNIILRPPSGAFTNLAWETTSRLNLTAADFPGVDFSATGGPVTFGYFRSNTINGSSSTITHGIDNWRVEICR